MSNLIDNPFVAVAVIFLIAGVFFGTTITGLIRSKQGERLNARDIRRRQAAEHALTEEKKAHAETTRALERQRLICTTCSYCNSGGAS